MTERERFEEHIIASYTRIPWKYESDILSLQMIFDHDYGPKFFYVVKLSNNGHLDWNCEEWSEWFGILSSYSDYVRAVCNIFSVLYGKVFEYVGKLKDSDTYYTVNFNQPVLNYSYLPWNTQDLRIDYREELNLTKLGRVFDELITKFLANDEKIIILSHIAAFYKKWIVNAELDSEISYIDFIRTIEVYNSYYQVWWSGSEVFDWELKQLWEKIAWDEELETIFMRYHWSTKKFINTILSFIPSESDFWSQTESKWEDFSLPKILNREKSLKKTYAVRSEYLHEWVSMWGCILPDKEGLNETVNAEPVYKTSIKSWVTLSLLWLERVVRRVLLEHIRNQSILTDW